MDYTCRHCSSNLDAGDVFEHFLNLYKPEKAIRIAKQYGWTPFNKIHFDRSIILQGEGDQYTICPDCGERDPLIRGTTF
jgi:DNA-directed RNA polymerase subunit RPC12/RpoP